MSIKEHYKTIINMGKTLENAVSTAMQEYRKTKQQATYEAEKYYPAKDNESSIEKNYRQGMIEKYIADKTGKAAENAKNSVLSAEKTFSAGALNNINKIREELRNTVVMPLNPVFISTLKMYHDYNISLSRTEIEALIQSANGSATAYEAINKTLEKSSSPFGLKYKAIRDYETELATLKRMIKTIKYIPNEYDKEGVELFRNTNVVYVRNDRELSTYETGEKYDTISIMLHRQMFLEAMNTAENAVSMFDNASCTLIQNDGETQPVEITETEYNPVIAEAAKKAEYDRIAVKGIEHYLK